MPTSFTRAVKGEPLPAALINDILDALEGVVGKGVSIRATQVEDPDNYALDVQQHDTVRGLVARFRGPDGQVLLAITRDGLTMADGVTLDGLAPGSHTHTGAEGQGPQIPTGGLADGALSADEAGRAQMQDGFVTLDKLAFRGGWTNDQAGPLRFEVKTVSVTLTSGDDNKAVSANWDTPFETLLGAFLGPISDITAKEIGRNSVFFAAMDASGFTVRAAASGGVATTYTIRVLGVGIGVGGEG